MKQHILLLLISLLPLYAAAQQRPQHSLYMINNYVLNPAITGIEDYADAKLSYRDQWKGVDGAPVTSYLSVHTPIGSAGNLANPGALKSKRPTYYQYRNSSRKRKPGKVKPHHGIGTMVMVDKIGPFQQFEAHLTYAYHILLSDRIKLSQGISAGFRQLSLNTSFITLENEADNAIGNGTIRQMRPDLSAGLWLYSDDFYVGTSASQLFSNSLTFSNEIISERLQQNTHYFVTAGYALAPSSQVMIIPSVMVKMVKASPPSVDLNVRAVYDSRAWAGLSYRNKESVTILTGFSVNPLLDINYAFDTGVTGISNHGTGSHEILLGFRLRNKNKVFCPQYLW